MLLHGALYFLFLPFRILLQEVNLEIILSSFSGKIFIMIRIFKVFFTTSLFYTKSICCCCLVLGHIQQCLTFTSGSTCKPVSLGNQMCARMAACK